MTLYAVVDRKNETMAGGHIKTEDITCLPVFISESDARKWLEMELAEFDASTIGANPADFIVVPARVEACGLTFDGDHGSSIKHADRKPPN